MVHQGRRVDGDGFFHLGVLMLALFIGLWWLSGAVFLWSLAFVFEKPSLRPEKLTIQDLLIAAIASWFGPIIIIFFGLAMLACWFEEKKIFEKVIWKRKE